jgi:hypothetical protein
MNDKLIKPMPIKHIHKPQVRSKGDAVKHYFTGTQWSKYATLAEAEQAANGRPVYVGEWNNKSRMWDMQERGNNYAK